MSSLGEIRRRIKSVENTKKLTRAMEMVAAAKLRRLQTNLAQSQRFGSELKRILTTLLVHDSSVTHPLLQQREETKSILAVVISSDTGLCGSYNTNIFECAAQFETHQTAPKFTFVALGKNGANYLKRKGLDVLHHLPVPKPREVDQTLETLLGMVCQMFLEEKADEVYFIYTMAETLGSLKPTARRLFPIVSRAEASAREEHLDYILEPSPAEILDVLVPQYIRAEISLFVRHALVAEQAARMTAMRQATDNAKEMVDSLTLLRNKARQASITKELIEVVSGSRASQAK